MFSMVLGPRLALGERKYVVEPKTIPQDKFLDMNRISLADRKK